MTTEPLGPAGALLITGERYPDDRGWFQEHWNQEKYSQLGLPSHFVQTNVSRSVRNVVRGMHFQTPNAQGKLVGVVAGRIRDVVVDIRPDSEWFGQWWAVELHGMEPQQVWCPRGFAHGFEVLSELALVVYMVDAQFEPAGDRVFSWADPDVDIEWITAQPVMSPKDASAPSLREALGLAEA